jgi:redox-sensitive bicupin YhaK (pirin superfamily)
MTPPGPGTSPAVAAVVVPTVRDLGDGFTVRRALPSAGCRTVGPFVFLDQMGPAPFAPGHGLDVRPHPHIGLSTLTYLFEGEILHRDSLGSVQAIAPGAVNWMTAGRGIAHSERTGDEPRANGQTLFGLQSWVALPRSEEEREPSFTHHPAATIPTASDTGVSLAVVAGAYAGLVSPVQAWSDLFYVDLTLAAGARHAIPATHVERALAVIAGAVGVAGEQGLHEPGVMVVLRPGAEIVLEAASPTRLVVFGGEPLAEPRHLFWNFVSSSKERIEQAKTDWREGRFDPVPGESEFIPLPV